MRTKIKLIVTIVLFVLCLVACGEDNSENDDTKKEDEKVVSLNVTEIKQIEVGKTEKLQYTLENAKNDAVVISSSDESVVKINNGSLEALKVGSAIIKVIVPTNRDSSEAVEKSFECTVIKPTFELNFNGDYTYSLDDSASYNLEYSESDNDSIVSSKGYKFESSDETVATISEKGEIKTLAEGKTTITVTSKWDDSYKYTIEINVKLDPLAVIASYNIDNPMYQNVKTYGSTELEQMVKGSVNYFTPMELNLVENIIPITDNSPYAGMTATEQLVAEAEAKNKYMRSGILHTETTKITYHDTGNNSKGADAEMHAKYLVSSGNQSSRARSWHYTVDDTQVIHHVPDNEVTWQGDSYYAYSTSIGIETCVDYGSELDITWHRTAKLMASLLVKYDMQITDIVQHYDWNGKNCPQTLRMNNLYPYAIKMVEAEYTALTLLKDYTITFKSLNPTLLDDNGHIINIPETATEVAYIVNITNGSGYNESKVLYATIPGLDGSTEDKNDNKNINEFYDLLTNITKDNYKDIVASFEKLSSSDKERATGLSYLLDKVKELLGGSSPRLSIEEIYLGTDLRYQYLEIRNNATMKISLTNYKIVCIDNLGNKTTFDFPSKTLEVGATYLINCAKNEAVETEESILPDFAISIDLNDIERIEIYKGDDLVDKVKFDSSVTRFGYSGNMDDDFLPLYRSPINSKGEKFEVHEDVTTNVVDFETMALAITLPLTKDSMTDITAAIAFYNTLTSKEKYQTRSYTYLKNLKSQCSTIK